MKTATTTRRPGRKPARQAQKESLISKVLIWVIIALVSPVALMFKIGLAWRGITVTRR